jgi:enoyl-CoA hydratase/carnithine racemase
MEIFECSRSGDSVWKDPGMSSADVRYERRGPAAVLTIDRPERRNAVDAATAVALRQGYEEFEADEDARVLVLTGAGGAFCAGADLKAIDLDVDDPAGPMGFSRLTPSKPTIAAIDGWCLAGGLELALWCDLRIATPRSVFGCFERRWGVPLIDGGTQRLPRVLGMGRALELILTGRPVEAEEAHRIGLVNELTAPGEHLERALELAERLASFPQETMLADRQATIEGAGMTLDDGLALEHRLGREVLRVAMEGASRFAGGEGRHGEGV